MALRSVTRDISIVDEGGTFNAFFKRFTRGSGEYDFDSLALLRKLLSNEKARVLHTVKTKNPGSIYALAKILGRDFKAVFEDIKLLERFGLVEMISEKTGKRERLKPVITAEHLRININI